MASPDFAERLQRAYQAAPNPEKPRMLIGPPGDPNAYYGWREARAVQSPEPQIPRVGPRELTPERIMRGLSGLPVFPEDEIEADEPMAEPPKRSFEVTIPRAPDPEHIIFKSGRRQQASRQEIISLHRNRGGRSPQNQGRHR